MIRSLLQGATYDDSISDMRRRLDAIPDDLDGFFKLILDDIPELYRPQSAMTFKIALAHRGRLPLIIHAYADEIHNPDYALSAPVKELERSYLYELTTQFPNRLDTRCKGLLEVVKDEYDRISPYYAYQVDFLHRTVRDCQGRAR